jgi:hypothetical protein
MLNTSKPFYPDLADKGKEDPYHRELTGSELEELAKLKAALDAENGIKPGDENA